MQEAARLGCAVTLLTVEIHARMLKALGMVSGVTHSEFIGAHGDGEYYFLETAARMGGGVLRRCLTVKRPEFG